MRRIHHAQTTREQLMLDLDEIARRGAQQMLAQALEAEVRAFTSRRPKANATNTDGRWSSGTATPRGARWYAGPEPSR